MRTRVLISLALMLACASNTAAAPDLLVGVTEDGLKTEPEAALNDARKLGLGAIRITLRWRPGLTRPTAAQLAELKQATSRSDGVSIVLSVLGERAIHAPTTGERRDQYCGFLAEIARRYDQIRHFTIWNEPNKTFFWSPQFDEDGASASPAAYGELLGRCWDLLHDVDPNVKVIAPSTSPRGNDNPNAISNVSHSPTRFVRELGRQYRESGRELPLFDVVGHHVHAVHAAERPWRAHPGTGVTQGDLDKLEQALSDAFAGTPQPVPGRCVEDKCVPVWWLEAGFQTEPDESKEPHYTGFEISPRPLPDSVGEVELEPLPESGSLAPDQATQIVSALRLAYCQPHVEAFFNFLLWDEQRLEGWQSAPLWYDRTPKGSYTAFRNAIREVGRGDVQCEEFRRAEAAEVARTDDVRGTTTEESPGAAPTSGANADGDEPAGLASSPVATEQAGDGGLSPWLLGGFAAAGALLATSALVYLLRRRRTRAL